MESIQLDPRIKEVLLRRTGSQLGEGMSEEAAAEEIAVIARLARPDESVPSLRVVARFGSVVTGRVPLGNVLELRRHPNIASLKVSRSYRPTLDSSVPEIRASPADLVAETGLTGIDGRGVTVCVMDWGLDTVHSCFRHAPSGDGLSRTRVLAIWDQRGGPQPGSPRQFGYGREITRGEIDAALAQPDPYRALAYDPADADGGGHGSHGTHVTDIAAGNGRARGSSPGVAPAADIAFCHLSADDTRPEDALGDSVRLLEAARWFVDRFGDRPLVINMSLGRTGGPHDDSPLVMQGLDTLVRERPGIAVVGSAGNYALTDMHTNGRCPAGGHVDLPWIAVPRHDEHSEMEVWYEGEDRFGAELLDPAGAVRARVPLGAEGVVAQDGRTIASIYHRRWDPNNGDNVVDVFLWPDAAVGTWTVRLRGEAVVDGRFHAWIERDDPGSQSRFAAPTTSSTIGSLTGTRNTIVVGAYQSRSPSRALVPFSSSGPTRDDRNKPDISAPGGSIRAAKSSRRLWGRREMDATTVKSGTSMAAPHVTGVVALMFQAAGNRRLSASEIRDILVRTARSSPPSKEADRLRYGAGRVDAAAAVREVVRLVATPARREEPVLVGASLSSASEGSAADVPMSSTGDLGASPIDDGMEGSLQPAAVDSLEPSLTPDTAGEGSALEPDPTPAASTAIDDGGWSGEGPDVDPFATGPIDEPLPTVEPASEAAEEETTAEDEPLPTDTFGEGLDPADDMEPPELDPIALTVNDLPGPEAAAEEEGPPHPDDPLAQAPAGVASVEVSLAAGDPELRLVLAARLPTLLVTMGDAELGRLDERGAPVYHPSQPLVFGPTGRTYQLPGGPPNYHSANFVLNTAHAIGYDVPVFPPTGGRAADGRAYHSLGEMFSSLAGDRDGGGYFDRFFSVVARAGTVLPDELRPGDLLLRGPDEVSGVGHLSIVVDPVPEDVGRFASADASSGRAVTCIGAGLRIERQADRVGRIVADDRGVVPDDRILLRFRDEAIDVPRAAALLDADPGYRALVLPTGDDRPGEERASTGEEYRPPGGRTVVPSADARAFRCAPNPVSVTRAAELPTRAAAPDTDLRTALRAAGLSSGALADFERERGFEGLRPFATRFGAAMLTELLGRLRYGSAALARPPSTYDRAGRRRLGVSNPAELLAPRLLLAIPGHFRQLARRAPSDQEAHALETLGWLLMASVRDDVSTATRLRWWMPSPPDWVGPFANSLPAVSDAVQRLITTSMLIDTTLAPGEFGARFRAWRVGPAGHQWRREVGLDPDPAGPGRPFYAAVANVPAAVDTAPQRLQVDRAWRERLANVDAAHPPLSDASTEQLRRCANEALPAGLFQDVALGGLELVYDYPVLQGVRPFRSLRVLGAIRPAVEAAFGAAAALGWNDLLFQCAGAACFRGVKLPRDPNDPDRHHRAARRLSNHSYGLALDFNTFENGQHAAGSLDPRVVALFEAFRFRWGRCFPVPDPMHLEYCGGAC